MSGYYCDCNLTLWVFQWMLLCSWLLISACFPQVTESRGKKFIKRNLAWVTYWCITSDKQEFDVFNWDCHMRWSTFLLYLVPQFVTNSSSIHWTKFSSIILFFNPIPFTLIRPKWIEAPHGPNRKMIWQLTYIMEGK